MVEMSKRIYERRKELNLTMRELGKKAGVNQSAVNKWEKGYVVNIPYPRLIRLAQALECSPAWLMGFSDDVGGEAKSDSEELLMLFNQASTEQREAALNLLRSFVGQKIAKS